MFGIPWETVQGGVNLNDGILSGITTTSEINWEGVMEGDDPMEYTTDAPAIWVQIMGGVNDGSYHKYCYVKNALTSFDEETGAYTTEKGWCDEAGNFASPELSPDNDGSLIPGTAVYFKDPSAKAAFSVTGAGAVNRDRQTIECGKDFRLRASMRPMGIQLNTPSQVTFEDLDDSSVINWEGVLEGDDPMEYTVNAPAIWVQIIGGVDDGSYHKYCYVKNALTSFNEETGAYTTDEGWCDEAGNFACPELSPDNDGTVPLMGGFFAKAGGDPTDKTTKFTMVFPKID